VVETGKATRGGELGGGGRCCFFGNILASLAAQISLTECLLVGWLPVTSVERFDYKLEARLQVRIEVPHSRSLRKAVSQ
jgi:hypothetical protein